MKHRPKIELAAQGQSPALLQKGKELPVLRARGGEGASHSQVKMRQPSGPSHLAAGVLPLRLDARQVAQNVDVVIRVIPCRFIRPRRVGQGDGIIDSFGARRCFEDDGVAIRRQAGGKRADAIAAGRSDNRSARSRG